MTLAVEQRPGAAGPDEPTQPPGQAEPDEPTQPPGGPGTGRLSARPPKLATWLPGAAVLLLTTLLVVFLADLSVVGALRHYRDQRTAYDGLRAALAEGTAPVGQTDAEGQLLPLGTPVALLEIPQIGLREVVLEGTTAGVLVSGPGHRRDSPLPGQAGTSVLFGRQAAFGGPFRPARRAGARQRDHGVDRAS